MTQQLLPAIEVPYNFKPRPYQIGPFKAWNRGIRRFFFRWCRRSGKDKLCINMLSPRMFERVGAYYYFFPTYQQGKKVIWEGADKAGFRFLDHIPKEWIKKRNQNEMMVELWNGSILRVIGSDNFDSVMGTNPLGIILSEYSLQQPQAFDFFRPILSQNEGWAIIQGTPRGKNHMYDMETKIQGDPSWYVSELQCLWPDLPNYYPVVSKLSDDEDLKNKLITYDEWWGRSVNQTMSAIDMDRKSGMTEELIEQEYGVSYTAGQKGAYYMDSIISARKEGRIGKYDYNPNLYVDTFWDIGLSDDTAIWFRQSDGNRLVFIDYFECNNKVISFYVDELVKRGYKYRAHYFPHDGKSRSIQTNMSTKDLFMRMCQEARIGHNVIIGQKPMNKQIPIMLVRERFSRYYFDENKCADGIKKLSLYHREWNKNANCFREYPAHDWTCHAADALATEAVTANQNDEYRNKSNSSIIITDFDPRDYETNKFPGNTPDIIL